MDKPAPAAQGGRGDRSRRHHPDRAQPTRRRLQRPRHRQHPHPHGTRARLAISKISPAQRRGLAPYRGPALSTARARIVTRQQIEDYQAVIQRAVIPARPRSQSGRWRHPLAGQAEDQATGRPHVGVHPYSPVDCSTTCSRRSAPHRAGGPSNWRSRCSSQARGTGREKISQMAPNAATAPPPCVG